MATLTADKVRTYGATSEVHRNKPPVIATDIIYEGAAVGRASAANAVRPLADGDTFFGFAINQADNSAGAEGDVRVLVHGEGVIKLDVTGVSGWDDAGKAVYATDDDTFSITDSGSDTQIGVIKEHISGTKCWVSFKAATVM